MRPFQALSHLMHLVLHCEKLKTSASNYILQGVCITEDCTEMQPQHAFAFDNIDNDTLWHADVIDAVRYCVHTTMTQTPPLTTLSVNYIDHHPSSVRWRLQLPPALALVPATKTTSHGLA